MLCNEIKSLSVVAKDVQYKHVQEICKLQNSKAQIMKEKPEKQADNQ